MWVGGLNVIFTVLSSSTYFHFCAVLTTSWGFVKEPELCRLLGCCCCCCCCWLDDVTGRLAWPSLPEPKEPALLRYCVRFTLCFGCCVCVFDALALFAVASVTWLEPPDSRRRRLLNECSTPLALSDTLLLRRVLAPCDLETSFIWGCNNNILVYILETNSFHFNFIQKLFSHLNYSKVFDSLEFLEIIMQFGVDIKFFTVLIILQERPKLFQSIKLT